MNDLCLKFFDVGTGIAARRIAVRRREGVAPGLFWVGGFKSDMKGTKAEALDLWARDHGRAMRAARALDFGAVWINTHIPFVSEMPHGGFKHSGYGKDLSGYGFDDYTRIKHVMSNIDA